MRTKNGVAILTLLSGCAAPQKAEIITLGGGNDADRQAQLAFQAGQWDTTIERYEKLLQTPAGNADKEGERHYWLSRAYSQRDGRINAATPTRESQSGDRQKALEHARIAWDVLRNRAKSSPPVRPQGLSARLMAPAGLQLASCLRACEAADQAEVVYRDLLHELPDPTRDRAVAWHELGAAYYESAVRQTKQLDRKALLNQAAECQYEALPIVSNSSGGSSDLAVAVHNAIGLIRLEQGRPAEARAAFARAEELSGNLKDSLQRAKVLVNLIGAEVELGQYDQVRERCTEIERQSKTASKPRILAALGFAALQIGDFAKATEKFDLARAAASMSADCRFDVDFRVQLDLNSAAAAQQLGDFDEAERRLQDAADQLFGAPDSVLMSAVRANHGRMLLTLERFDGAEVELEAALKALRDSLGPRHPQTLLIQLDLVSLARARGQLVDARHLCDETLNALVAARGAKHPQYAQALLESAKLHRDEGRCPDALQEAVQATEILDEQWGSRHKQAVLAFLERTMLAVECRSTELPTLRAEAEDRFRQLRDDLGLDNVEVLRVMVLAADLRASEGGVDQTVFDRYVHAEENFVRIYGETTLSVAVLRLKQGKFLERVGKQDEAIKTYERALLSLDEDLRAHPTRAWLLAAAARLHGVRGDADLARRLCEEAYTILASAYGYDSRATQALRTDCEK